MMRAGTPHCSTSQSQNTSGLPPTEQRVSRGEGEWSETAVRTLEKETDSQSVENNYSATKMSLN